MRISILFSLVALMTLSFLGSCKKEDPLNPHLITQEFYFQAVLDGDTVTYQEGISNYGNIVGDFFGGEVPNGWEYAPFTCIASNRAVSSPSPTPSDLSESGAVAVISLNPTQVTNLQTYQTLFQSGPQDFGFLSRSPAIAATEGAYVSLFDENGLEWNTNFGIQDSTASFIVTEYYGSIDNNRFPPTQQIFAAEFNCKVYNSAGASKTLTGGKVRGRMIIFQ